MRLAGFGAVAEVDPDLVGWNYGEYEDLSRLRVSLPIGALPRRLPCGESPRDVASGAGRVLSRVRDLQRDVLLFSSRHFSRTGRALDWRQGGG